jgi:hypothetical protein
MTEDEWLACDDPQRMLEFLRVRLLSDRKLRLFSVACCRVLWGLFNHPASRTAIEVAERFADEPSLQDELDSAFDSVDGLFDPDGEPNIESQLACAVCEAPPNAGWVMRGIQVLPSRRTRFRGLARPKAHLKLLRDIFGNPFQPSTRLQSAVFTWNDSTIPRIAEGIYDERRMPEGTFDTGRLAILSDALLDAGCDNEDLIAHCRSPGTHVRGCWAIDQILAKE